ncbi:MAG: hypothetical protein Q8P51_08115, partial [Ignavibacteria bacterium]|nr:hypothetical protein [Ignavibacteria bacterium]
NHKPNGNGVNREVRARGSSVLWRRIRRKPKAKRWPGHEHLLQEEALQSITIHRSKYLLTKPDSCPFDFDDI